MSLLIRDSEASRAEWNRKTRDAANGLMRRLAGSRSPARERRLEGRGGRDGVSGEEKLCAIFKFQKTMGRRRTSAEPWGFPSSS